MNILRSRNRGFALVIAWLLFMSVGKLFPDWVGYVAFAIGLIGLGLAMHDLQHDPGNNNPLDNQTPPS